MKGLQLDKWQEQILESKGNIALRSGRQVGKSTTIAILAGEYAINNPDKAVMIIAATERQAYLLFEKVMEYVDANYRKEIKTNKDKPTKSRLVLKNNSKIYSLPTGLTGYGIRGYTIDLLIADEAAFIPEAVFAAITPSLATRENSRIILLSTPYGRKGYFARAFSDERFQKYHISSEDCPRIDKDFLKAERERMTQKDYAQEYLGEFVDDLMQWFSDELILKCMKGKRQYPQGKNYYIGIDLARMGEDESTFEIIEMKNDKTLVQVENQITRKTLLSQTTRHIIDLQAIWKFQKIFIDDEGIGVGVYDNLLEEDTTKRIIIPINNSKRVLDSQKKQTTKLLKEDLYNNLLHLMEKGKIILLDDPEIFQSLKSVHYEYTTDKMGRSHLKIGGSYTHIAEGLVRACWCVRYKPLNIWIDSI
jgi:hypothetical protein